MIITEYSCIFLHISYTQDLQVHQLLQTLAAEVGIPVVASTGNAAVQEADL